MRNIHTKGLNDKQTEEPFDKQRERKTKRPIYKQTVRQRDQMTKTDRQMNFMKNRHTKGSNDRHTDKGNK